MARLSELDFSTFVRQRRQAQPGAQDDDAHAYAYSSDRTTRAAFQAAKPVELAVAAGVRLFEQLEKARLLGSAVKVGPRQFPHVHEVTRHCASTLGIPVPTLYVVSSPYLNGATYGTNEESFILLHSALVDHFSAEELTSVIGHECGHIHNSHVVYLTALHTLSNVAGALVRWVGLPAVLGLKAWSRRAEITCDRAGALCTGDLSVALRALTKLALGSQKLYEQLDVDVFLEQHEEAKDNVGRYGEVFSTHPWLPKRVLALRAFGESELFRKRANLGSGGLAMRVVDERVHELIKVLG